MSEIITLMCFSVPETHDIYNLESPQSGPILAAINTVLRSCKYCAWGRVQKEKDLTILISNWQSLETYEAFIDSPDGKTCLSALEALGHHENREASANIDGSFKAIVTLSIALPSIRRFSHRSPLRAHTQLRLIFFPAPVSEEQKVSTQKRSGPTLPLMWSNEAFEQMSDYHKEPMVGWCLQSVDWPEEQIHTKANANRFPSSAREVLNYDVLVTLISWRSAEKEQHFRDTAVAMTKNGLVPVFEDWEQGLEEDGAIGWKDIYVDFEMVNKEVQRKAKTQ